MQVCGLVWEQDGPMCVQTSDASNSGATGRRVIRSADVLRVSMSGDGGGQGFNKSVIESMRSTNL